MGICSLDSTPAIYIYTEPIFQELIKPNIKFNMVIYDHPLLTSTH